MTQERRTTHTLFGSVALDLDERLCFALMPFCEPFNEMWENTVKKVIREAGLNPRRADDIYAPGVIAQDVWQSILRARVLIADLTGRNPNVFYEVGLAHAIEKDVILLVENVEDLPFDLRHLRVIIYGATPSGQATLVEALSKALAEILKGPSSPIAPSLRFDAAASAVSELQRQHVLAPSPFLKADFMSAYANGEPVEPSVELSNIGQGMALNCLYSARAVWEGAEEFPGGMHPYIQRFYRSPASSPYTSPLHLGVGQSQRLPLSSVPAEREYDIFHLAGDLAYRLGIVQAVICLDQDGTRYRFRSDRPMPDRWKPDDGLAPMWAQLLDQ